MKRLLALVLFAGVLLAIPVTAGAEAGDIVRCSEIWYHDEPSDYPYTCLAEWHGDKTCDGNKEIAVRGRAEIAGAIGSFVVIDHRLATVWDTDNFLDPHGSKVNNSERTLQMQNPPLGFESIMTYHTGLKRAKHATMYIEVDRGSLPPGPVPLQTQLRVKVICR